METEWPITIEGIKPQRLIGQGGFGQVWLAEQTDLDRPVAVKIGHRPFTVDDDRRRFERECKALGRLSGHRNIIGVYTSGLSSGLPYLVLQYVDGGTLAEHGPALGEARLRQVTDELCEAVAAAHNIGVLHRDLKPENVFLDRDGHAVLGDFGIARLGDGNNTEAGGITASMAFVAPDILEGKPPSPAADIYGIGITIVAAILGRSPFVTGQEIDLHAIVANVLQVDPPDLAPYGISPPFEALLRRAMHKDPAQRPATVAELQAELRQLPSPSAPPTRAGLAAAQPPAAPNPPAAHLPGTRSANGLPSQFAGSVVAPRPTSNRSRVFYAVGIGAAAVALAIVAFLLLRPEDPPGSADATAAEENQIGPSVTSQDPEPSTDMSASTTSEPTPKPPLALPLSGPILSDLADIPFDFDGLDPLLGPADRAQFCEGEQPDITGMTETLAAVYPRDPTIEGSLRQVAQRLHRFDTPEQAANFVQTYTTFSCDVWEETEPNSGEVTVYRSTVVEPTVVYGDETARVDQVVTLDIGVDIYNAAVLVRSDTDVYKVVYYSIDQDELGEVTDRLVAQAIATLGY